MDLDRRKKVLDSHLLRNRLSFDDKNYQEACLAYFEFQAKLDLPAGCEDVTSKLTLKDRAKCVVKAELVLKQDGMLAGIEESMWFLKQQKQITDVFSDAVDGEFARSGRRILFLQGEADYLLFVERHLVNFLQRMGGLATQAYEIIGAAAGFNPYVLICPTRKTYFGPLDKKAIVVAGGGSHRVYLSDAVLVKENHFASAGVSSSVADFQHFLSSLTKHKENLAFVEVEVETPDQALRVAQILRDIKHRNNSHVPYGILLDNFNTAQIIRTLSEIKQLGFWDDLFFEASGGITQNSLRDYVNSGVDIVSMGVLTNQSPTLDISLEIVSL